eukprot:SAG31_NODE_2228_length_6146_cov_4.401191_1_plen_88_part_00
MAPRGRGTRRGGAARLLARQVAGILNLSTWSELGRAVPAVDIENISKFTTVGVMQSHVSSRGLFTNRTVYIHYVLFQYCPPQLEVIY